MQFIWICVIMAAGISSIGDWYQAFLQFDT